MYAESILNEDKKTLNSHFGEYEDLLAFSQNNHEDENLPEYCLNVLLVLSQIAITVFMVVLAIITVENIYPTVFLLLKFR